MAAMLLPFATLPWPRATLLPRSLLSILRLLMMPVAGCMLLKFVHKDYHENFGYSSMVGPINKST